VAISGHQWSSVVISGHQWSSMEIGGHHDPSVVIRGHQWSSVALTCSDCAIIECSGSGSSVRLDGTPTERAACNAMISWAPGDDITRGDQKAISSQHAIRGNSEGNHGNQKAISMQTEANLKAITGPSAGSSPGMNTRIAPGGNQGVIRRSSGRHQSSSGSSPGMNTRIAPGGRCASR
jgi:hypothetical protein